MYFFWWPFASTVYVKGYTTQHPFNMPVDSRKANPEEFKKANKCQKKGGVWINDSCQISLD